MFAGIKRTMGTAQDRKAPLLADTLRRIVTALPDTTKGIRDRALLLLGFAAALRRSELVDLDIEHLEFGPDGLVVILTRRKTDQEGQGTRIGVPRGIHPATCPVGAVRAWLDRAGIADGPVFRRITKGGKVRSGRLGDRTVARVVQEAVAGVGLDPAEFGGHSLRAGLATSAAAHGVEERKIMDQTGHKSVTMVRKYIREGELFRGNAAGRVGL